jgi:hypothetical protein
LFLGSSITLGTPGVVGAQVREQPLQLEYRLDALVAHTTGAEAALGASVPAGLYVRTGLVAGIGAGAHGAEGRTDLFSRFSLDPFRQSRWAPYAGGGISGRYRSRLDGGSAPISWFFSASKARSRLAAPQGSSPRSRWALAAERAFQ